MKAKAKKVKTFVEPALNDLELRYRRLFEAAQDGILILDAKTGAITDVNPYLIDMLGYSRDEFVDKKLWEVGAFRDINASREAFEALQQEKYIRYEDLPLKAKDGHLVQVEFVSNAYLVGREEVIQCNIRNINERKQAEEIVESLSKFPDENPAPVLRVTEQGIILYANKASQVVLEEWKVATGQAVPTFWLTKIAEVVETQSQQFIDFPLGARVFSFAINPIIDKGYVNFYGTDITERKRAEEAVAKERNLLLTLINNLPDRIYAKDTEGRKIISNIADWQASGGQRMEDVLGKTDFDTYPAELADGFWVDDKVVLSGKPIINREEPGRDSQGNPIWTLTTKVPLRDDKGQVVGLVGVGRDITERKRGEELQTQLAAIVEFIARCYLFLFA